MVSVPFPLRFWMASDHKIMKTVNSTIVRIIETYIKEKAQKRGIRNSHTGAVSFIQRWGGGLNLNPHLMLTRPWLCELSLPMRKQKMLLQIRMVT